MAGPDLRVLVGVLGGASISGESGQQIVKEVKAIASQITGRHMPRVAVSVDINQTKRIFQQQLQQVVNGLDIKAPVKTKLLANQVLPTIDAAKLKESGLEYIQASGDIVKEAQKHFAHLGKVDITSIFKTPQGEIQRFTAAVKKADGTVEHYYRKLALLQNGTSEFKAFIPTGSTGADRTSGTDLQKTLNYLSAIDTKIANITSRTTVSSGKPLLPDMAEFSDYAAKMQQVHSRIQEIRNANSVLSDEHKREINSMVADLQRYARELQSAAYAGSELKAQTFAAQKAQMQAGLEVQIKKWTSAGVFGGDFAQAVNQAKTQLDSATDSAGLDEYTRKLRLLKTEFTSIGLDKGSFDQLMQGNTLAKSIETAQLKIQNLKTTYSSFVSDPNLMQEWQALFDQSQIVKTQKGLTNLNAQIGLFEQKLIAAGRHSANMASQFAENFGKMASWMVLGTLVSTIMGGIRGIYQETVRLDSAMVNLRKVTSETDAAYSHFLDSAYDKAIKLGTSVTDLVTATANFARLGYHLNQAAELAEAAVIYQNVGDDITTVEDATRSLVSTTKAYKIQAKDAIDIVDKLNAVGNNFSISSGGIGEALQRSASALSVANNTLDESIALIVAANNVVQDPDVVGTMWKTVSMRIRGAVAELERAGLETDYMAKTTSKLRDDVKALTNVNGLGGFDIMVDDSTFKSTYDIVLGISKVWEDMSNIDQAALLELLAGKRQGNALASAITNMDDAVKVLNTSLNSSGSAYAEHSKWLDSIEAKQQQFSAQYQEFANAVLDSGLVKGTIDFGTGLLGTLTEIIKSLGMLPGLIGAVGGIHSAASNRGLFQIDETKDWGGSGIGITFFRNMTKSMEEFAKQAKIDVACLQQFEDAVASGSYKAENFDQILTGASERARTYAVETQGAKESTQAFKASQDAIVKSMGHVNIKAKLAAVGVQALNIALNTLIWMGVGAAINLAAVGFDKLANATSHAGEKADEFTRRQKELASAAAEEVSSLDELIAKYEQLRSGEYVNAETSQQIRDIQNEITALVGTQVNYLDLVNGKLDEELKKLKGISLMSALEAQDAAVGAYRASRGSADKAVGDKEYLFVGGYDYVGAYDKSAHELLKDLRSDEGLPLATQGGGFGSKLFFNTYGDAEERIEQLRQAAEALKFADDYDYSNSSLYAGLQEQISFYEGYVEQVKQSALDLTDATAAIAVQES